ncbi:autotransporter outer membrane beta-barrel domain-containing protein [Avibacterium sp. 20-15]|uniref:S6 family peptidase n=1 Tax=unclassified Avibacterium TaxID=2685287 RepID=UPI0020260AD0|nr:MULTISPECIES: S6 family peptidase [unclassified Avibacterium]MCW9732059.1 autotransporter outer membrane beta-barrel domain-containing protein [Avibacterium sp. 20-15]URL04238.1 autotransporter outer membrane beta-barrel domain-containing protein [Avibacterium sp. 20-132]
MMKLTPTFCFPIPFRYSRIALLIASCATPFAQASVVRSDIDYQYFRDFAENKGKFIVGASNIAIFNKEGQEIGVMMKDIPMPDLRAANRETGIATLISPQYITSVTHNGEYPNVSFGGEDYNPDSHHYFYEIVDRNNYPYPVNEKKVDYHIPRLHKLVTEVVPANVNDAEQTRAVYTDTSRFPIYVRVGSGTQFIRYSDKKDDLKQIAGPYVYLTGGAAMIISDVTDGRKVGDFIERRMASNGWTSLFNDKYGPMATYARGGDSGSGIYAFDKQKNQWVLSGVLNFESGDNFNTNIWTLPILGFIAEKENEDLAGSISNQRAGDIWQWRVSENSSFISHSTNALPVALKDQKESNIQAAKNAGKNVKFGGVDGGVLILENDINQGAGALYFDSDFTVKPKANQTWLGAGVYIAKDKTVTWQVANPKDDRLSKIGEGTLLVKGKGVNLGDISIGDGTVILAQEADDEGKKQAFNQVGIVSGRPTVVLQSSDQIDPNKLYFGFRGGRLDLNGNALVFDRIQNVDEGAMIVNHHLLNPANVTLKASLSDSFVMGHKPTDDGDFFEFYNLFERENQYFRPKTPAQERRRNKGAASFPYFEEERAISYFWEYLGTDKEKAIEQLRLKQKYLFSYSGFFGEKDKTKHNGKLNIHYSPDVPKAIYQFTGGMALNGELSINNGELILSGRQTPHARDFLNKKEVIFDDDWINRDFSANTISVTNQGIFTVGRNVSSLSADINATNNAVLNLGYQPTQKVCLRSDYTGEVSCDTPTYNENVLNTIPRTQFTGDVTLSEQSALNLGKTDFIGAIQSENTSQTVLSKEAHWKLTKNSTLGNLTLDEGAQVTLSQENKPFNTLTINGDLSGKGKFYYRTKFSTRESDQVVVNGQASGEHTLVVNDAGSEPERSKARLTLLTANGLSDNLSVTLQNNYADIGTYRYNLIKEGNAFRLYNPIVEKQIEQEERQAAEEQARREAEVKRLEEARKAAEEQGRREAEAKRLEEERKAAAEEQARREAEAKRLEEERKAAAEEQARREAEAKRLEEERKAAAEEQARREAEAKRLEEERKAAAEEQARREAEAKRLEEERKAEAEEQARREAEAKRLEEERKAEAEEQARREAEAKRLEEERKAEAEEQARREAEAKRLEEARKAAAEEQARREAEAKRLEEARKAAAEEQARREAEAKRLEETRKAAAEEQARREAEAKRLEEERKAVAEEQARREAEAKRLEEERKAEAEEQARREAEAKRLEEERKAEAEEQARREAEAKRLEEERKAEAEEQARREAEAKRLEEERKVAAEEQAHREAEAKRLKQAELVSRVSNTGLSELSAQVNVVLEKDQHLNQRLFQAGSQQAQLWTNVGVQRGDYQSDNYRHYEQYSSYTELGAESPLNEQGISVGAMVSHTRANMNYDQASGKLRYSQATLYGKIQNSKGLFAAIDLGYGRSNNQITLDSHSIKFKRNIFAAGMSLGKKWDLGYMDLNTLLGLRYHHFTKAHYTLEDASIDSPSLDLVNYYAGAELSKTWSWESVSITPKLALYYFDASRKTFDHAIMVNNNRLVQQFNRGWQYQTGLDFGVGVFSMGMTFTYEKSQEAANNRLVDLKVTYKF